MAGWAPSASGPTSADTGYVFTDEPDQPRYPDDLLDQRFSSLADPVHPKVASERLGHLTTAITPSTYSHVPRWHRVVQGR